MKGDELHRWQPHTHHRQPLARARVGGGDTIRHPAVPIPGQHHSGFYPHPVGFNFIFQGIRRPRSALHGLWYRTCIPGVNSGIVQAMHQMPKVFVSVCLSVSFFTACHTFCFWSRSPVLLLPGRAVHNGQMHDAHCTAQSKITTAGRRRVDGRQRQLGDNQWCLEACSCCPVLTQGGFVSGGGHERRPCCVKWNDVFIVGVQVLSLRRETQS